MDFTKVIVMGVTKTNWPSVREVFVRRGYTPYKIGTSDLTYMPHVSGYEGERVNGWSGEKFVDFKEQLRTVKEQAPELQRLTVARFLKEFG